MTTSWDHKSWRESFQKSETQIFIVRSKENEIIAMGVFDCSELMQQAHLLKIAVGVGYRTKGIAEKLLRHSIESLKKEGLNNIYLEVSTENTPAVSLYTKYGFKMLTTKKKFYSNGHDAYAMQYYFQ